MAGQAKSSETGFGRKLAVGALAAAGVMLGTGLPAAADGCRAYPPAAVLDSDSVELSDTTPEPGASVTVAVSDCLVGERIDVVFGGNQMVGTCVASGAPGSDAEAAALGQAEVVLAAPPVTGVYVGTVALHDGSVCGSFQLEVTGGVLPQQPDNPQQPNNPQSPGGNTPSVQPPTGVLPATGTNVVPLLMSASVAALVTGGALLFGVRLRRSRATA